MIVLISILVIVGLIPFGILFVVFKSAAKAAKIYLSSIAIAALSIFVMREKIREGYFGNNFGAACNLFIPPGDLFHKNSVRLIPGVQNYAIKFNTKYPGNYMVSLDSLKRSNDDSGLRKFSNILTTISVFNENALMYKSRNDTGYGFWYWDNGGGIGFPSFRTPDQIPLGKTLTIKIHIDGNIDSLIKSNPIAAVSVGKASDE